MNRACGGQNTVSLLGAGNQSQYRGYLIRKRSKSDKALTGKDYLNKSDQSKANRPNLHLGELEAPYLTEDDDEDQYSLKWYLSLLCPRDRCCPMAIPPSHDHGFVPESDSANQQAIGSVDAQRENC